MLVLEGEILREELQHALNLSDRKHCRKSYLFPAIQAGLIKLTIPEKPKSPLQKYRLTTKGIEYKDNLL